MAKIYRRCEFPGCNNLGMALGKNIQRRGKLCGTHHRLKYKMPKSGTYNKRKYIYVKGHGGRASGKQFADKEVVKVSLLPCSKCGWNESYCDRHRIIPELGYRKDNVVPLCPNCHRVEHLKFGEKFRRKQQSVKGDVFG